VSIFLTIILLLYVDQLRQARMDAVRWFASSFVIIAAIAAIVLLELADRGAL